MTFLTTRRNTTHPLAAGPPALTELKRVRQVLQERGVESEAHPVLQVAWSKRERQPL
jgi:RpiR family carbohydrate utilization transcriptional regulator